MRIKEYAAGKGVTQGAIYKAIGRAGHSAKDLTDRKGNITPKGSAILDELFPDDQETRSEPLNEEKAGDSTLDDLRARLSEAERAREKAEDALKVEREQRIKAEAQAEKWENLYLELQDKAAQEREANRTALTQAHILAARAQEAANKKTGILRLFSGRKKDKDIDAQAEIT